MRAPLETEWLWLLAAESRMLLARLMLVIWPALLAVEFAGATFVVVVVAVVDDAVVVCLRFCCFLFFALLF